MSKNSVDILFQNIEIPEIVQEKAQDAFAQIRLEAKADNRKVVHHFWKTKAAAIMLAAFVGGGSITALAAAYMQWSHGMQSQMNVSDEQMVELQNAEDTPLSFPEVSDTQSDITVSVAQCLVDDSDIRLAFYVDGYELPSNEEPQLGDLTIRLDGEQVYNYVWSFYSGIDWDANRNPVMADGSDVKETAEGAIIPNYRTADGKMEIDLQLSPIDGNGEMISELKGKTITVQICDFGETVGTWTLEWTLEGTDTVIEKELKEVLGNSGATVTAIKVSPISVKVCYDFAPQIIYDKGVDENGNAIEYTDYAEPPKFVGVKMKDGTVYTGICGGGTYGYEDIASSVFVAEVSLSRVINPEEVQSLLFLREDITLTEGEITEEQCYAVDMK